MMVNRCNLMEAVWTSNLSMIEVLMLQEDVNQQDEDGNTPLHQAVTMLHLVPRRRKNSSGGYDAVKPSGRCINDLMVDIILCLAKKGDITVRNNDGKQPVDLIVDSDMEFWDDVGSERISHVMESLITQDTVDHRDAFGRSLLYRSVYKNQYRLVEMLLKKGADVTATSTFRNESPLHVFARDRDCEALELVEELAKDGMLNAQDSSGNTALHTAVQYGNLSVYRELKRLNADMRIRNRRNELATDVRLARIAIEPELFNDLLKELMDQGKEANTLEYLHIFCDVLTNLSSKTGLKSLLLTLAERLPVTLDLRGLRCKASVENNFVSVQVCIDNKNIGVLMLRQTEGLFRMLAVLPDVQIHGDNPDPLYVRGRFSNAEDAQLAKGIDQLWKNCAAKEKQIPGLSHLCRRFIRDLLHPVTGAKIDSFKLSADLDSFIRQTDIADLLYDIVMDY